MKERMDLWVQELRSGKYRQGPGLLNKIDSWGSTFCCLGVLAVSCGAEYHYDDGVLTTAGSRTTLNDDWFYKITGLTPPIQSLLARMNDIGISFEDIANILDVSQGFDSILSDARTIIEQRIINYILDHPEAAYELEFDDESTEIELNSYFSGYPHEIYV